MRQRPASGGVSSPRKFKPDSLLGAKKRQNKITDYREMLLAWKQAKIMTVGGYLLGFPNDAPASIVHDMNAIQDQLPIDLLEFFFLRAARFGRPQDALCEGRRNRSGPQRIRSRPRHSCAFEHVKGGVGMCL